MNMIAQTFSTIGFGDFAIGPKDGDVLNPTSAGSEFVLLHAQVQPPSTTGISARARSYCGRSYYPRMNVCVPPQAIIIFFGLATFNTFASTGVEWLEVVVLEVTAKVLSLSRSRTCWRRRLRKIAPGPSSSSATQADSSSSTSSKMKGGDEVTLEPGPLNGLEKSTTAHHPPSDSSPRKRLCTWFIYSLRTWRPNCALRLRCISALALTTRAILVAYSVMLFGGLLLYIAEAQTEIDIACAARAEENIMRVNMRLPALVPGICE